FRNTVVIMTSNLGSDRIQGMGEEADYNEMKSAVMEVVSTHFRPEFINRVDDVVVFHALAKSHIRKIVEIQLERLKQRLGERDLTLQIEADALDQLAEVGFDPVYGARPLKRAIQTEIENPLAERILAGEFSGGQMITVRPSNSSAGTQNLEFEAA
ncbi:MAG: AAA family ATPase, partial [Pseudomonadota bacterium]